MRQAKLFSGDLETARVYL